MWMHFLDSEINFPSDFSLCQVVKKQLVHCPICSFLDFNTSAVRYIFVFCLSVCWFEIGTFYVSSNFGFSCFNFLRVKVTGTVKSWRRNVIWNLFNINCLQRMQQRGTLLLCDLKILCNIKNLIQENRCKWK